MDRNRWQNMTIYQQMGNIAGEISRARHWQDRHDMPSRDRSLERALELVDLTIEQNRNSHRVRELVRFREAVGQWLIDAHDFDVLPEELENYCLPFAVAARQGVKRGS